MQYESAAPGAEGRITDKAAGASRPRFAASATAGKRLGEAYVLLLGTHFVVDCFSSTLPTMQPILAERFELSLTQAGILGGFWMFSSSLLQLPFGLLSDRLQSRYYTVLSPLAAALFLTAMGWASSFGLLIGLLLLGGMGVAAYHPHSTSQAGLVAGDRRGIATAIFIAVGTAGLGLGPIYLAAVVDRFGFERLWIAAVPAAAMAPVLFWRMPGPTGDARARGPAVDWHALRSAGKPLLTHYSLVVLRSIVQVGLAQFLSLYLVLVRGLNLNAASVALAVHFASTSAGSFLGGTASDWLGGRRVIVASAILSGPLLAAFMALEGWPSLLALFLGGVCLFATIPVHVIMAQELAPSQASTTTAMMMGFGWGTAGIVFVPTLGWLADMEGLGTVLWALAGLPALSLPLALTLPQGRTGRLGRFRRTPRKR